MATTGKQEEIANLYKSAIKSKDAGKLTEAKKSFDEAVELCYRYLEPGDELTYKIQYEQAMTLLNLGNHDEALHSSYEAFLSAKKHLGPKHETTTNLARVLFVIKMSTSTNFTAIIKFCVENGINYNQFIGELK